MSDSNSRAVLVAAITDHRAEEFQKQKGPAWFSKGTKEHEKGPVPSEGTVRELRTV
jgi:hypothetical protein